MPLPVCGPRVDGCPGLSVPKPAVPGAPVTTFVQQPDSVACPDGCPAGGADPGWAAVSNVQQLKLMTQRATGESEGSLQPVCPPWDWINLPDNLLDL